MSDRMTEVSAPGAIGGLAAYGRHTRPEMIARYRSHFQFRLEQAQRALAVPDDQLVVETYVGVWAQNNKKVVE